MSLFEDTNPRALKELLSEIHNRTAVLPDFQRDFVWHLTLPFVRIRPFVDEVRERVREEVSVPCPRLDWILLIQAVLCT